MMSDNPKDRVILHCDCNNFFASVELLTRPELRNVPVAVAGDTDSRHGIILAKNMPAKKMGIVTAETVWSAKKKCPTLVLLPPHHTLYHRISQRINQIYLAYTDQVEPFSVDESFLDVTASQTLFGDGVTIADTLRRRVREEIGITISVGVSFNKTWAKMGSDYLKPDATTVMDRTTGPKLLFPQKVDNMLFVGRSTAQILHANGIHTIGDIVKTGEAPLSRLLGKSGSGLWRSASGRDDSPVLQWGTQEEAKSISHATTFPYDLVGRDACHEALLSLSNELGIRLRKAHKKGSTLCIQIKNPQLQVISRQTQLPFPTGSTDVIFRDACALFDRSWDSRMPVRLLSVGLSDLIDENAAFPFQMSLFEEEVQDDPRRVKLEKTIDELQTRFGADTISRGKTGMRYSAKERNPEHSP